MLIYFTCYIYIYINLYLISIIVFNHSLIRGDSRFSVLSVLSPTENRTDLISFVKNENRTNVQ